MIKNCIRCHTDKPFTFEFFPRSSGFSINGQPFRSVCKDCFNANLRKVRNENLVERRRKDREYNRKRRNPTKEDKRIRRNKLQSEYRRNRREEPEFRLRELIRSRLTREIKRIKSTKYKVAQNSYLGCTTAQLKVHLEDQFQPGMTWDNHGWGNDKWHIDHIVPMASAKTRDGIYELCHYSNLQPLWQPDNFAKSDKVDPSLLNTRLSQSSQETIKIILSKLSPFRRAVSDQPD